MNKEWPRLVAAMLPLVLGLIVGITLGQSRRYPGSQVAPDPVRASPAAAVEGVERQDVGRRRLKVKPTDRRTLRLLPRAERVAWGSLWAVSILVIVIYLLNSFARPGSGTVAPSVESFSYDPVPTPALSVHLLETRPVDSTLGVRYALAHYADAPSTWQFSNPSIQDSGYDEGEHVPFMLRVENAIPGSTYVFAIRYDCAHSGGNGYDFLDGYSRGRGAAPALHRDGPGTVLPDAALAIPHDPSIPIDDGKYDRAFQLWGGSFASPATGPSSDSPCLAEGGPESEKMYTVAIRAQAETVYLLWSAHAASPVD